jgi:hypothetical protein
MRLNRNLKMEYWNQQIFLIKFLILLKIYLDAIKNQSNVKI